MLRTLVPQRMARYTRPLACLRLLVAIATPTSAAAQLAPDSPRLISPHGSSGLGVHWVRSDALPGSEGALLATWAPAPLPDGLRLRTAMGRGAAGSSAVLGGVDLQVPLRRGGSLRSLAIDWQSGAGISFGDYTILTIPVGLTGGVSWTSGSVWLAPWASAGFAADMRLGGAAPAEEFVVTPAFEVGADLALDVERRFVFRTAVALGERQAVSLGLAYGLGRLAR